MANCPNCKTMVHKFVLLPATRDAQQRNAAVPAAIKLLRLIRGALANKGRIYPEDFRKEIDAVLKTAAGGWRVTLAHWADAPPEKVIMEEKTYVPFLNCGWKSSEDGCCSHPSNATPECHQFICPIKAAQHSVRWTGGESGGFCERHAIVFSGDSCPLCLTRQ